MFSKEKQSKVGNTLIYLAEKLHPLYLTKALKLLYILDETSMKEVGVPFTWLEYKVWEKGPVAVEIYESCKSKNNSCLTDYIKCIIEPTSTFIEKYKLEPIDKFDDSEFTDYELQLLNKVVIDYGRFTAIELIDKLHNDDTLWYKAVKTHKLDLEFKLQGSKSNFTIQLTDLIANNPMLQLAYQTAYSAFDDNEFSQSQ